MKALMLAAVVALAIPATGQTPMPASTPKPMQLAAFCSFSHETVSGMNKLCFYKCISGMTAITIASYKICPISLDG